MLLNRCIFVIVVIHVDFKVKKKLQWMHIYISKVLFSPDRNRLWCYAINPSPFLKTISDDKLVYAETVYVYTTCVMLINANAIRCKTTILRYVWWICSIPCLFPKIIILFDVNSWRLNDAYWFVHIMALCLFGYNPLKKQMVVYCKSDSHWNFNIKTTLFNQENWFRTVFCNISAILYPGISVLNGSILYLHGVQYYV